MECSLEKRTRLYEALIELEKGYEGYSFENFFKLLSKDCVLESQWVLNPIVGYEAVVEYYRRKSQAFRSNETCIWGYVVELEGDNNPINVVANIEGEKKEARVGLMYESGKLCLVLEQDATPKTVEVLIDLTINSEGMISRIDICMPELYRYREFYVNSYAFPSLKDTREIGARIALGVEEFEALSFFIECENFDIREDYECIDKAVVPKKVWNKIMNYWKIYLESKNFDDALEKIAGIDYGNNTVKNKGALWRMCTSQLEIITSIEKKRKFYDYLIEWTNKYKQRFDNIILEEQND